MASLQPEIDRSYAQAGTGQQMTVESNVGGSHWGGKYYFFKRQCHQADEERLIQLFRDAVSTMPDLTAKIDDQSCLVSARHWK